MVLCCVVFLIARLENFLIASSVLEVVVYYVLLSLSFILILVHYLLAFYY
jgi:hypothetical protein